MWIVDKRGMRRGNPYSPEYIAHRDGITIDAATRQIEQYKIAKTTNLAGFILRHG